MSEASKRSSVFYGRGPFARFRYWRFNRRIERIPSDLPEDFRTVFAGNVSLSEVVYAPGTTLDDALTDFDWKQQEC